MFENSDDALSFDHSRLDERSRQARFLDAVHIPTCLRSALSLSALARTKFGNRCNDITHEWEQAQSEHATKRWRRWLSTRRERTYKRDLGFRNSLALAVGFVLLVWTGIGIQRSTVPRVRKLPTSYSVPAASRPERISVAVPPEIRRDDFGQLVQVRAADPQSVLLSFCSNAEESLCEPTELAWGVPRHADVRYGVYRSFHDLRAIEIVRDPRTRQWVAGDGTRPVNDFLAHARGMSHKRIPVLDR